MKNRIFKFRIWDTKEKIFLIKDDGCFRSSDYIYSLGSILEGVYKNLIPLPFTGLKDGDDVEIYEGDIIKIPTDPYSYVVAWDEDYSSWHMAFQNENFGDCLLKDDSNGYRVVGNIFENPELIK